MVCEISLRRVTCLCVVKTLTPGHMQSVVKEFPKRVLSFRPKKALALSSIHEGTHFADLHWHQPLGQRRVGRSYPSLSMGFDTRRDCEFVHIVRALAKMFEETGCHRD